MSKKIYVGNLHYSVDEDTLRQVFAKIGEVQSVKIVTDASGRSRGFGFVEMTSDEDAKKAISDLNGTTLVDRTLIVNEARPQTARGRTGGTGGQKRFDRRGSRLGNWR
ncbi:MAG: RNA-binding protein [Nitrospirota bacterium]